MCVQEKCLPKTGVHKKCFQKNLYIYKINVFRKIENHMNKLHLSIVLFQTNVLPTYIDYGVKRFCLQTGDTGECLIFPNKCGKVHLYCDAISERTGGTEA